MTRALVPTPPVAAARATSLVALAAVAGLVVVPIVRLVQEMPGTDSVRRVLAAPGLRTAAAHSVELALSIPLVAVPVGTATALVLHRPGVPCRAALRVLVLLPLVVPQFVLGYSWTEAYARGGFTDQLFGLRWDGLLGAAGVFVVLVVDAAPLSYLLTTLALRTRAQPALEDAAHVSGAGTVVALRTVVLPLLRPVLVAEFVLTAILTLESFAAPQVLGSPAGYATLTTRMYADLQFASDPASFDDAMTLALGLVIVAAIVLVPADLLLAPRLRTTRTAQITRPASRGRRSGGAVAGAVLLGGYAVFAVLLPTLALLAAAVTRAVGLDPTPGNWTLDNFRAALDAPTRAALLHSVQLALVAAALLTALGAAAAVLERRRAGRLVGTMAMLTFALPGSALAVALLISYGSGLAGSLTLILVAYLAKFWALAQRSVSGVLDRLPPGEMHAARVAGAGPVAAVRTVWLPALTPGLIGAAALVFIACLHEVTMSSLLYATGSETFAVAVLNSQELGQASTTAALSITLTAVVVAVAAAAWLVQRFATRARTGSRVADHG